MVGISNGARLFTVDDVAQAVGGKVAHRGARLIARVATDSRAVVDGTLFVPLSGARVDGHDFILQALENGASAVLVENRYWEKHGATLAGPFEGRQAACVLTEKNLDSLQDLARHHLARFPKLYRIGITGSSGKTTTKELVGAILAQGRRTFVSEGNLNSEIGVPLAAFRVTAEHEFAVFEMGIDHKGEMDILASIVRPDLAVVTNIGSAHIGILGSRENIAEEKRRIACRLGARGAFFLHEDEPYADALCRDFPGRVIRYGVKSTQGFQGSRSLGLDGTAIDWEGLQIRFPLVGVHNLRNALAAISVASFLGVPPDDVRRGLEAAAPVFGRSEVLRGDISIIKDCYNANPDSMENALNFLDELDWQGRKVAVLGSMKELGGRSADYHRRIGEHAAAKFFDLVFFFGGEMREAYLAAQRPSDRANVFHFSDFEELSRAVGRGIRSGDIVLVKGSRAMELERLVPVLLGFSGKGKS